MEKFKLLSYLKILACGAVIITLHAWVYEISTTNSVVLFVVSLIAYGNVLYFDEFDHTDVNYFFNPVCIVGQSGLNASENESYHLLFSSVTNQGEVEKYSTAISRIKEISYNLSGTIGSNAMKINITLKY